MRTDFLTQWSTDEASAPKAAARMARRRWWMTFAKRILAVFAVLGIIVIGVMAYFNTVDNRFQLDFSTIQNADTLPPVMVNPLYQGMDNAGRPFTVTAELATQQDADEVALQTLQADITMQDGSWVTIKSRHGYVELQNRMLYLDGTVNFFHDAGYNLLTESVTVDMKTGVARGVEEVKGSGPMGALRADGFVISSEKDHIRFGKNVKLIVRPPGGRAQ